MAFVLTGPAVPVRHAGLNVESLHRLTHETMQAHRLRGAAVAHGQDWLIGFRCKSADHAAVLKQEGSFGCFRWDGNFGSAYTFSSYHELSKTKRKWAGRAWLWSRHPACEQLKSHRALTFVPIYNGKPVSVIRAHLEKDHIVLADKRIGFDELTNHRTEDESRPYKTLIDLDEDIAYWETLARADVWNHLLTLQDHLQVGWAREFVLEMRHLHLMVRSGDAPLPFNPDDTVESLVSTFGVSEEVCRTVLVPVGCALLGRSSLLETIRRLDRRALWMHLSRFFQNAPQKDPLDPVRIWVGALLDCASMNDQLTDYGRRYVSIAHVGLGDQVMEIDTTFITDTVTAARYWKDMPDSSAIGLCISTKRHQIPADMAAVSQGLLEIHLDCTVAEASDAVRTLSEEANILYRWTIPWGARVQVQIGPFSEVEFFPYGDEIDILLKTAPGHYRCAAFNLRKDLWNFVHVFRNRNENTPVDERRAPEIEQALKLVLAAIVRDFVVVEERESVFATRRVNLNPTKSQESGASIIYIPRVHYSGTGDVHALNATLEYAVRRPHHVRAHLRVAEQLSEHQKVLAERYGFELKPGYTFVRPHHRGGISAEREVIYRSRSAMQSLFSVAPEVASLGKSLWFQFERDVYSAMRDLGYRVDHVASAGNGDDGIDVYAENPSKNEFWAIQCKCYVPKRRVGPIIVRELLGALIKYPGGTRGMIVSTSDYSSGAVALAKEQGIALRRMFNGCLIDAVT